MKRLYPLALLAMATVFAFPLTGIATAQDHADHSGNHDDHASVMKDHSAVRASIDALFDAMRAGSGDAVRAVFADGARLMSTGTRDGVPFVRQTPIDGFAGAVDNAAEGSWDEQIFNVMINVDGNLASAWTPYAFYHDGKLSHCGVNAMQLVRSEGGWKILQLTDTRQTEGCDVPERSGG